MSNQVHRIESYTFSSTDVLLFDTNVWLYIYGPQGKQFPRYRNIYTYALRRIRSAKGRILLDILVLSEFINAYARFFYNNLPSIFKPTTTLSNIVEAIALVQNPYTFSITSSSGANA